MTSASDTAPVILSIGHSTLAYDQFLARLKQAGATAVADVRTAPFSRHFPQFNRDVLKAALTGDGIAYVFLGDELGGRPSEAESYTDGVADYEKMARSQSFRRGLDRLRQGARTYRIAMMCSERNPLDCHRCLLVGRALKQAGVDVEHLVEDGERLTQDDIEARLMVMANKFNTDMFAEEAQMLTDAYRDRARRVAYAELHPDPALAAS